MKKMESILMVILVLFAFGLAGCGTASFPSSSPVPEMISLESPLYIIEGENQVEGFMDFGEKMQSIYGEVSLLGGYPLVEGVEKYLEDIRGSNTILLISPTPEGMQEFRDLEAMYSDLCLISSVELELELEFHSSPLLYFSFLYCQSDDSGSAWGGGTLPGCEDGQDKIRGIIVAEQVNPGLAKLLSEGVLLNVFFRYENGQLQILE